jgi:hypothetical protein
MKPFRLAILLLLGLTTAAAAAIVTGHASCDAFWDTGSAVVSGSHLDCHDGDPTCDTDGVVNHVCTIALTACVDTPTGTCTPEPLTSIKFGAPVTKKLVGFQPPVVGSPNCGTPGTITIPLRAKKHGTVFKNSRPVKLLMKGKPRFKDTLLVRCVPAAPGHCPLRTDNPAFPAEVDLTVPLEDAQHPELGNGSDLDNGWTGSTHNFPIIGGSTVRYCLSGCDGVTTFDCQASGTTAAGTEANPVNGPTFGSPLPLLAAQVPVCVVNSYRDPVLTGTFNLQTGEGGSAANPNLVHLNSDVYLTSGNEVCPKCQVSGTGGIGSTGTCSSSARAPGASCTVDGVVTVAGHGLYLLSSQCPPSGASMATLKINLPFTTGPTIPLVGPLPCAGQTTDDGCNGGACNATCTGAACAGTNAAGECVDAKGGISQLCCANATSTPCFPSKGGGSITRSGKPGTAGNIMVNAALFCIDATQSGIINITAGLPGPGALLLPVKVSVLP